MKLLSLTLTLAAAGCVSFSAAAQSLRPPSVPLVASDPYFSIWSPGDKLTDVDTTHWTGKPQRLASLVRIDGKSFRLMGTEPSEVPSLPQSKLEVLPTRTIYTFQGVGIRLSLAFMTADLPEDLDLLSRPVTYLTWSAESTDGQKHAISVYFDARSETAVNVPSQAVTFEPSDSPGIKAWRVGTVEQPVLQKKGDDLRIDWGYFYVATSAKDKRESVSAGTAQAARAGFLASGALPAPADAASLQDNDRNDSVIAFVANLGDVREKAASCSLILAYDDLYSIQYMKKNLRPYWRRNGWEAKDLLSAAARDYPALQKRCAAFDNELMADLLAAGGENYAALGALAYRQCFAAGKFVADGHGQPLQFCKENHSNGCISTSDVFYPMSPQFLLFGPTLAKSFMVPFMNYAASARWTFPFAPHDLGTYPQANGQVYGDGERGLQNQMPVEESGNLLCLFAAVAQMEGNANFAGLYWKQLEQWANYLKEKGFDPENQLCTDDFAGHLAHNVNLSAKAICGLGAFAKLCEMRGEHAQAEEYAQFAHECAQRWVKEADAGDHFRLAFDRPDTWSQKYNLVWDRILGLNLFPAEVAQKEMAFYKTVLNQYGLPLDNRETYTKLDWTIWTASLTQNRADFETLVAPVIAFLNATPDRSPMTDWYQTKTARKVGFTGRPVVGGVFIQMLYQTEIWQKYALRDRTKASNWASMPLPPKVVVVLPAADKQPALWKYTVAKPADRWMSSGFDDASWPQGQSGFGTVGTPGAVIGTVWKTDDIWLRRQIDLPSRNFEDLQGWLHHDEDVEVYFNGVLAVKTAGFIANYELFPLTSQAKAALKPGKNLVAIHCHQTTGGQYVDFGLVDVQSAEPAPANQAGR
ncbi:MAG TPA: DUF4965 domain-containing protein [Candidatus Acidoferrales bacterium]|nr:DUF4965 domain-containing protein [Candidatus Acidoferrales bacterium]